jgi:hypothetical protein
MIDVQQLRRRAEEHRAVARTTADTWGCTIRFALAARYEELAAHYETLSVRTEETPRPRQAPRARKR